MLALDSESGIAKSEVIMVIIIVAALIIAYIGYTFVYSIVHGYTDGAILIAVATAVVALLLWCEAAWAVMK